MGSEDQGLAAWLMRIPAVRRYFERASAKAQLSIRAQILGDPVMHAHNAGLNTARLDISDEDAVDRLRTELVDVAPEQITRTLARHFSARDGYLIDRSYRLLVAMRDATEVSPVPTDRRSQFGREAHLGRIPIPEAFAELAQAEPRLRQLETEPRLGPRVNRLLRPVVGPDSDNADPVLAGEIAHEIAAHYLWRPSGTRGQIRRALFDGERQILSGMLGAPQDGS